jgi:sensor histidine kinase YesM
MLMSEQASNYRPIYEGFFHFVFWLLFIHFLFDIQGLLDSFEFLWSSQSFQVIDEAFLWLPIAILLFYWNLLFLIPKFLHLGNWIRFSISLLISYIAFYFFSSWAFDFFIHQGFTFIIPKQEYLDLAIQFNLQIVIVSTTLGIAKTAVQNLYQRREAEKRQKEAELKYLSQQFNPHFLHNTLNGIYAKALEEDAPQTTEAILQLSEIMRYPIKQGSQKQVSLKEEISFIENYIALQKLRLGEDYPIEFKKEGEIQDQKILPLSLIILVENAFKYGISQNHKHPILFHLKLQADHLRFITQNQISEREQMSTHKVGLKNLESRLEIVYKDQFLLEKSIDQNEFTMSIRIPFQ